MWSACAFSYTFTKTSGSRCISSLTSCAHSISFLHVSQDADEIYLRFTQPTANYLGFLHNDKHKLTELSAGDYLSVYTFGPFHVWNDDELRRLIIILLAFRSDMKRIVETSPTDWFRLRRNNCCNSHAAPLQAHE